MGHVGNGIVIPRLAGLLQVFWSVRSSAMDFRFKVNDWVVYTREKYSLSPGRRAKNISPSPHGEMYSYQVDKYWVVRQTLPNAVVLETRTGKQHQLCITDRRLRHATWWERFFYSDRFPRRNSSEDSNSPATRTNSGDPRGFMASRSI